MLGLLFLLTACPKKADVVEPKKNDLIGKWEWMGYHCDNWFGIISPSTSNRNHYVLFDIDSVTYYSEDTIIYKSKYIFKSTEKVILIDFAKLELNKGSQYNYLFTDGSYQVNTDSLFISKSGCHISFKKIKKS